MHVDVVRFRVLSKTGKKLSQNHFQHTVSTANYFDSACVLGGDIRKEDEDDCVELIVCYGSGARIMRNITRMHEKRGEKVILLKLWQGKRADAYARDIFGEHFEFHLRKNKPYGYSRIKCLHSGRGNFSYISDDEIFIKSEFAMLSHVSM